MSIEVFSDARKSLIFGCWLIYTLNVGCRNQVFFSPIVRMSTVYWRLVHWSVSFSTSRIIFGTEPLLVISKNFLPKIDFWSSIFILIVGSALLMLRISLRICLSLTDDNDSVYKSSIICRPLAMNFEHGYKKLVTK